MSSAVAKSKTPARSASAAPATVAPVAQAFHTTPGGVSAAAIQCSSMKVSSPKDSAEKEADSTAKRIMRMPDNSAGTNQEKKELSSSQGDKAIARKAKAEEKETNTAKTIMRMALKSTTPTEEKKEPSSKPAEKTIARQIAKEEKTVARQATKDEKKETAPVQQASSSLSRKETSEKTPEKKEDSAAGGGIKIARRTMSDIHRKGEGQPNVSSNVQADIQSSLSSGNPLPLSVRRFMEPRFNADFSNVRVHTDDRSSRLNTQLSAQAFTVGNNIFFGRNRFKPDQEEGRELIAHELTHTIQQGAVTQHNAATTGVSRQVNDTVHRSEETTVTQTSAPQIQRLGVSDALDYFADKAYNIPGFRMFTIVLGVNPINMSRAERSAANIMRAIVEFLPGGNIITRALDNYGVFDKVGTWVEQQIASLSMTGSVIRKAVMDFLDSLGWRDIFDLGGVWNRAKRIFTEPIDRIIAFARGLYNGIVQFVKDAILKPLAQLASQTRAWDLLIAVLGFNPITGEPVPRTAETLLGGFMRLIGQEEVWQNIQRGNAIGRAWAWFQGALAGLMGFVRQIPSLFMATLRSLTLMDIVVITGAFAKVRSVFGSFAGQFVSWAMGTVISLLEILFSVVAPGAMPYIRRAAGAFQTILRNPIGFVGNLVRAARLGFQQFAARIGSHLRNSLIQWLTGSMGGAGVYIPQSFSLREIIKFVLSVLGLTWQNIRVKLVRAIGEAPVRAMETGFELVRTLVTEGPAAAWQQIQEGITNLQQMVMEQIMNFVVTRVVQAAITRLVTSLNPAGAIIQAIIAIYNTVMFFIERLRQIMQVATAFVNSIMAIASGQIGAAANRVEQTMAGLLTLVISFLARIAGLGRVSDAVVGIINRIRAPIDRALDRVVAWIVNMARRAGRFVAQAGVPQDPETRVRLASEAAVAAASRLTGTISEGLLNPILRGIQTRYGLTRITPSQQNGEWWVEVVINPRRRTRLRASTTASADRVSIPPIVAKLDQATEMFRLFQSRGTSAVAGTVISELSAAKTEALAIDRAQNTSTPPATLTRMKQNLSTRLTAIQNLDPGYSLFSIAGLAITITQARRRTSLISPTPWDVIDPSLRPEYVSQLNSQADGINSMTAEQWLQNRNQYVTSGRSSAEARLRAAYRRRTGSGRAAGTAAPHNADQVAGGFEDPTGLPVNSGVNSHIGSQWPSRVGTLESVANALRGVAKVVTQMYVRLRPR